MAGYKVSNGMDAPTRYRRDVPERKCRQPLDLEGPSAMQIATVGLDLAKHVFQVHGASRHGKAELQGELKPE